MGQYLVYNLGRRGFFSEINNLVLAWIYAEDNGWDFKANSFYWNCRSDLGLRDYFVPGLKETNNPFSAQMTRVDSDRKFCFSDLHSWFYAGCDLLNSLYLTFNSKAILGSTIYDNIRAEDFRNNINPERFLEKLRRVLTPNKWLSGEIESYLREIALPEKYIGIHIRRGDKISTGEMDNIPLSVYADAIKASGLKDVYIATDDINSVKELKSMLSDGYNLYHNPLLEGDGFSEGGFNKMSRQARKDDTLTLLKDVFALFGASKFIGTYSSNLSRVIPAALGLDRCTSLDDAWFIG